MDQPTAEGSNNQLPVATRSKVVLATILGVGLVAVVATGSAAYVIDHPSAPGPAVPPQQVMSIFASPQTAADVLPSEASQLAGPGSSSSRLLGTTTGATYYATVDDGGLCLVTVSSSSGLSDGCGGPPTEGDSEPLLLSTDDPGGPGIALVADNFIPPTDSGWTWRKIGRNLYSFA